MNEARKSLTSPIYDVENPYKKATDTMSQASGTFGRMQAGSRTETEGPGKTLGGGMMAGAGLGMSGYMAAGMTAGGLTGPQGAMVGVGIGLAAYLLS